MFDIMFLVLLNGKEKQKLTISFCSGFLFYGTFSAKWLKKEHYIKVLFSCTYLDILVLAIHNK